MSKFNKLSRAEMKNVLGGGDEITATVCNIYCTASSAAKSIASCSAVDAHAVCGEDLSNSSCGCG